jgi:U3 small nucleolar RNA-associated protein MPP10
MPEEDIEKFITKMEEDLDVLDDKEFDGEENKEDRKVYKELYGDSLSDEESNEQEEESEEEESNARKKTLFQRHQEELLETIEEMENENMKEKEWQKRGEIIAKDRPVNSLLEDDLIFEHQSKSKPIITEEVTRDLESIIISRIIAGVFDDPERPDIEDKKENAQNVVNLQHEKSKKSLAEIYEEMYLKKVEGKNIDLDLSQTDPKVAKERNKIKHMMANTLYMLNKLSSFNYVPPPIAEFETVEDGSKVKPIDVKATKKQEEEKMAPQEILKPIRELPAANAERTADERKRKRREVKEKQAKKTKKAKELVDLVNPAATGDKEKNEKLLKQLKEKNSKSQQIDPNVSSYSSSKRFFELMQEKSSKYSSEGKAKKKDKHKGST